MLRKKHLAILALVLCLVASHFASAEPAGLVRVPIIMYHNISNKPKLVGKFCVSEAQFESDLRYLQDNGYHTVTMTQLINYVKYETPLPENPIIITFDDGYESFYAYACPLLEKYDMVAVMSIIGSYTDLFTETEDHNLEYSHLTWDQVKELTDGEVAEIQNHTYDMHTNTNERYGCSIGPHETLDRYKAALYADVLSLQKMIFEHTGSLPNTFAYPFGAMCGESVDILKEMGFEATLSCTEVINKIVPGTDCLQMLGRFNRPGTMTTEAFFRHVFRE